MKYVILMTSAIILSGCVKREDCEKYREAYQRERTNIERCAAVENCRVDMETIRWETHYRVNLMKCERNRNDKD